MTERERCELMLSNHINGPATSCLIDDVMLFVEQNVARERERCLAICRKVDGRQSDGEATQIADLIREGT